MSAIMLRIFFVGELDRKTICCVLAVKCASNFAFIAHYIVDEPYQSKGFGIRVWKVAVASLSDSYNVGGHAVLERVHMYGT